MQSRVDAVAAHVVTIGDASLDGAHIGGAIVVERRLVEVGAECRVGEEAAGLHAVLLLKGEEEGVMVSGERGLGRCTKGLQLYHTSVSCFNLAARAASMRACTMGSTLGLAGTAARCCCCCCCCCCCSGCCWRLVALPRGTAGCAAAGIGALACSSRGGDRPGASSTSSTPGAS